jgi:ribosome recycling factor
MKLEINNTYQLIEFLEQYGMEVPQEEIYKIVRKSIPNSNIIFCKIINRTDLDYIIKQIKASHLPFDIKTLYGN